MNESAPIEQVPNEIPLDQSPEVVPMGDYVDQNSVFTETQKLDELQKEGADKKEKTKLPKQPFQFRTIQILALAASAALTGTIAHKAGKDQGKEVGKIAQKAEDEKEMVSSMEKLETLAALATEINESRNRFEGTGLVFAFKDERRDKILKIYNEQERRFNALKSKIKAMREKLKSLGQVSEKELSDLRSEVNLELLNTELRREVFGEAERGLDSIEKTNVNENYKIGMSQRIFEIFTIKIEKLEPISPEDDGKK